MGLGRLTVDSLEALGSWVSVLKMPMSRRLKNAANMIHLTLTGRMLERKLPPLQSKEENDRTQMTKAIDGDQDAKKPRLQMS